MARRRRARRTRRSRTARRSRRWIQQAIRNPGALKRWLKRNEDRIKRLTGENPFTETGEVNTRALLKLRKTSWYRRLSPTTKRRINLAITLEKFHKG